MSDVAKPLSGAQFAGFVNIEETAPSGMITLRADLGAAVTAKAVKAAVGTKMPDPRQIVQGTSGAAAWMSPDEVLLICGYRDVADALSAIGKAMGQSHHLAADVSDARVRFTLSGSGIREVLAKLSPADLSERGLPVGELRRSRLAQVPAAFWFDDASTAHVICFRSVAQYVFDILKVAATPGTEVGVL